MEGRDILHQEKRFMMSDVFTPGCAQQYVLGGCTKCGGEGMSVQSDKRNLALFPVLLKTFKEKSIFCIANDII